MSATPLPPGPEEVHLWWIDLAAAGGDVHALLSPPERERAARFRFPRDRERWVRTRAAVRHILAAYDGAPPRTLPLVHQSGGKPALAGGSPLRFSLTHAGDRAALAVAWEREVGIDLEPLDPGLDIAPLLPVVCAPEEIARLASLPDDAQPAAFLTLWTLKEAYLKAIGVGLAREPRTIAVHALPDGRATVHDPLGEQAATRCRLRLLDAGPGWVAALAVAGAGVVVADYAWPHPGADWGF